MGMSPTQPFWGNGLNNGSSRCSETSDWNPNGTEFLGNKDKPSSLSMDFHRGVLGMLAKSSVISSRQLVGIL